jgi:hypothetical protein
MKWKVYVIHSDMIREAKKVVVLDEVSGDFTFIEGTKL